jgi:hypothetical protein
MSRCEETRGAVVPSARTEHRGLPDLHETQNPAASQSTREQSKNQQRATPKLGGIYT